MITTSNFSLHKNHLKYTFVCASNQNRSMAAHHAVLFGNPPTSFHLVKEQVSSFGTGAQVKLPGKSATKPNVYEFGQGYEEMIKDLKEKDEQYYIANGVLPMLERNAMVKLAPERFQKHFQFADVLITFEDRVFDAVIDDLQYRSLSSQEYYSNKPCHIINITINDNHKDAEKGAQLCRELVEQIETSPDWENEIVSILTKFEEKNKNYLPKQRVLHVVLFL